MENSKLLGRVVSMSELHHNAKNVLNRLKDEKWLVVAKHSKALAVILSPDEYLRLKTLAGEHIRDKES